MELEACPRCGYEIECVEGVVCSECGVVLDGPGLGVVRERARVMGVVGRETKVQTWAWVGVLVVYGLGAWMAMGERMAFFVAAIGLGIGLIGSMGVGLGLAWFAPAHERVFVRWVWRRWFPVLHGPWLVIGPLTLLGGVVGLIVRVFDGYDAALVLWACAGIVFAGWVLLIPVWLIVWGMLTARSAYELGIGFRSRSVVWGGIVCWALVVVAVCSMVGFPGGQAGFWFARTVAGVEGIEVWDF